MFPFCTLQIIMVHFLFHNQSYHVKNKFGFIETKSLNIVTSWIINASKELIRDAICVNMTRDLRIDLEESFFNSIDLVFLKSNEELVTQFSITISKLCYNILFLNQRLLQDELNFYSLLSICVCESNKMWRHIPRETILCKFYCV